MVHLEGSLLPTPFAPCCPENIVVVFNTGNMVYISGCRPVNYRSLATCLIKAGKTYVFRKSF